MALRHHVMLNEVKHLNEYHCNPWRCFAALNMTMPLLQNKTRGM
jgi:hypothetical protein